MAHCVSSADVPRVGPGGCESSRCLWPIRMNDGAADAAGMTPGVCQGKHFLRFLIANVIRRVVLVESGRIHTRAETADRGLLSGSRAECEDVCVCLGGWGMRMGGSVCRCSFFCTRDASRVAADEKATRLQRIRSVFKTNTWTCRSFRHLYDKNWQIAASLAR